MADVMFFGIQLKLESKAYGVSRRGVCDVNVMCYVLYHLSS